MLRDFFASRRRPDLNRRIEVLQTCALPLGYCAILFRPAYVSLRPPPDASPSIANPEN